MVRVIRKTFAPPANRSQAYYDVDLELAPIRMPPQGAFDNYGPGGSYPVPELIAPTTPGRLLVAVVVTQSAAESTIPDPTFRDDPDELVDPAYGWTIAGSTYARRRSTVDGDPTDPVGVAIAWRYVQPGEVTVHPMSASNGPGRAVGVWLWEFEGASVGSATSSTTLGTPSLHPDPSNYTIGTSLTGFVFGALALMNADFGNPPVDVHAVSGTTVSSTANDNSTPPAAHGWSVPWVWMGQKSGGGVLTAYLESEAGYADTGVCGVSVELVGVTNVPTIPYPANQV